MGTVRAVPPMDTVSRAGGLHSSPSSPLDRAHEENQEDLQQFEQNMVHTEEMGEMGELPGCALWATAWWRLIKNSMEGSSTDGHTGRVGRGLRAGAGAKAPITISPPGGQPAAGRGTA